MALGTWLVSCVLWGCSTPQDVQDESACTTVCRCSDAPVPSVQEECISACMLELGPVDDDCASCIAEHANACSTLEDDCIPLC
jgi:hypothetical protein